ncbi:transcriptional regulator [Halobacteriota archaeon]
MRIGEMMMEELVGYVTGNTKRIQIIQVLGKGKLEVGKVAKITHTPERLTVKVLKGLEEKGLVKADGKTYTLTDVGAEVESRIKSL